MVINAFWSWLIGLGLKQVRVVIDKLYASHGPEGRMASVWPTGSMVLWIGILLGVTLVLNFI